MLYLARADPDVSVEGDTHTYTSPALALLDEGHFDQSPDDDRPEFLRTPGYPAFIAAVYRVFGESRTALLLTQVALSALTVLVVYLLAGRIWSATTGLVAAGLATLEPLQQYSAGTIVSESLAALLLMLVAAAGFVVFAQENPRLRWPLLLGLAMAAATMVRPVTYYLPVVVVLLLLYRILRRPEQWSYGLQMLVSFLVPVVVIVGGWQLRNHMEVESWRISAVEARNLYLYRAAGVIADQEDISLDAAQRRLDARLGDIGDEGEGAYYGRMHREGLSILASNPIDTAEIMGKGLFRELTSVRFKVFRFLRLEPASGATELAATVLLIAFYLVCVYGVILVVRERRNLLAHLFIIGVAVYVLLASAGPEALDAGRGERFRAPIVPILILYAAHAWTALLSRLRRPRRPADQGA